MSVQTAPVVGFADASALPLPKLLCVGTWNKIDVEKAKVTAKGIYTYIPLQLNGRAGSKNMRLSFLYCPEWFRPGFSVKSFKDFGDEGSKMDFVYGKNISRYDSQSVLKAFAGSYENYLELASRIFALSDEEVSDVTTVVETLNAFHETNPDRLIGYILKQKSTKTYDVDPETGKHEYILENAYEVDDFFIPSDEKHEMKEWRGTLKNRINGTKRGRTKLGFDPEMIEVF